MRSLASKDHPRMTAELEESVAGVALERGPRGSLFPVACRWSAKKFALDVRDVARIRSPAYGPHTVWCPGAAFDCLGSTCSDTTRGGTAPPGKE